MNTQYQQKDFGGGKRYVKNLAGMLIKAQEEERARIARELHDNLNQQIAALSISLSEVMNKLRDTRSVAIRDLSPLQKKVSQIANEVRNISHDLHPGVLRHAGLYATARRNCNEFSARFGIKTQFLAAGDFDAVPMDVALCLYRILQEALHNIQAHAAARNVKVCLTRSSKGVDLIVIDDGRGFDEEKVRTQGGLGLLSMVERVRLLNGEIQIDTLPSFGTNLRVQIPI